MVNRNLFRHFKPKIKVEKRGNLYYVRAIDMYDGKVYTKKLKHTKLYLKWLKQIWTPIINTIGYITVDQWGYPLAVWMSEEEFQKFKDAFKNITKIEVEQKE